MKDTELIDLYFERNEQAIVVTQEKYGNYCHSIAFNILYDKGDTEECLNDTWLRAWNSIPPQRPNKLQLFLGKITRNLALDRYKARHAAKRGGGCVEVALDELAECLAAEDTVEDLTMAAELERSIHSFLEKLPARECNVFLRRYWYMEDYQTIADKYHMKLNTVKTLLFRTRCKLKEHLEQEGIVI